MASSPLPTIPMDCERDGEAGRGGSFEARLVDDWFPWDRLVVDIWRPSSAGDVGLLDPPEGRFEVPLSRALL